MDKSYVILIAFFLFQCTAEELTPDADCGINPGTSRGLKISVKSRRNQTNDWVDTFTARAECTNSSDSINVDVTHRVMECEGKRVIFIQGVSKVNQEEFFEEKRETKEKFTFHPRCGKNIAISGDGRSVQKINMEDPINAVVFTNRPLKDNEIFEVRLDKKISKFTHSLGIGIIQHSPTNVDILPEMYKSPHSWIYHHNHIYSKGGDVVLKNYARNINELQVGDRVGVMRNQFGALHYFVNGVDQGPAASGLPSEVYGVFELWGDAVKATIVDASSPSSSS